MLTWIYFRLARHPCTMGEVEVDGWFLGSEMAMATDLVASEHHCRSNSFTPKLVGGREMGGEEGAWRVGHKKVDWTPGTVVSGGLF